MTPHHVPQTVSHFNAWPTWRRWRFLMALIERNGLKAGAELGLRKGGTSDFLLKHCPDLHMLGVDLWAPSGGYEDWTHEKHERECRKTLAQYGERAKIIKGLTTKVALEVPDRSLDFVFIDADHSEQGVRDDITAWLPKIKETGFITGHDINWPGVRAAVDDLVPGYLIGPDVVWFRPVNPPDGWQKDW